MTWLVLPDAVPGITPRAVTSLRRHYYRMRDAADALAAEQRAANEPLSARLPTLVVRTDIQAGIDSCDAWLRRVARMGGRGQLIEDEAATAANGAHATVAAGCGADPGCRGSAPTAMAHGCAALASPAVGPADAQPSGATDATPDNPLFFAREGKACRGLQPSVTLNAAQEAASDENTI